MQLARAAGPDAELVFLLADREAGGAALDEKRRDAAIARLGVDRRKDDEEVGFVAVGDPELAPGEDVGVAVLPGARREREGVAAGAGLRQRVRADRARRRARGASGA